MSGRSAYVRKVKTQVKDGASVAGESKSQHSQNSGSQDLSYRDFPVPAGHPQAHSNEVQLKKQTAATRSVRSDEADDMAYARAKRPQLPNLEISGIEKSATREKMDKMSENARKAFLGMSFGRKKKNKEDEQQDTARPETSATVRPMNELYKQEEQQNQTYTSPLATNFSPPQQHHFAPPQPQPQRNRANSTMHDISEEPSRIPPPTSALPALPPPPQIKRWLGNGRHPTNWNKLRKDPELWDPHGDTLVFLGHESHRVARSPPSFRVSSHVLEATDSRFFMTALRNGYVDDRRDNEMPPSPVSSPDRTGRHGGRMLQSRQGGHPTPPASDSAGSGQDPDGEISYELHFPPPLNLSKVESLRYHLTTRNVFAMLCQTSLVGLNFNQALMDLYERLQIYMSPESDCAGLIIDYLIARGLDDVRNDVHSAVALLAWSEHKLVRWQEGWREAFVHCAGMQDRLELIPDMRLVTPITRALLERASLESQVRVQAAEDRLLDFNFGDMWPPMSATPPPERGCFERLRMFFLNFYEASMGGWPVRSDRDEWLTRNLIRSLQTDFGALYEYLVNRDVEWDGSEERSSRKWNIVRRGAANMFSADTAELPMTDILVAFDNRHRFPHIPHPYPLVPESIPPQAPRDPVKRPNKGQHGQSEDRIADRRAALAYTEATNIYILTDFTPNRLVEAFVRFEKMDQPGQVDPFVARRGRWVLIYGILQVLASVSVDAPGLRWKDDVPYHLNHRLRGTQPWKGADTNIVEASHEQSYCWLSPSSWKQDVAEMPALEPPTRNALRFGVGGIGTSDIGSAYGGSSRGGQYSIRSSLATVSTESDAGGSLKSPVTVHARMARRAGVKPQLRDFERDREREREKDGFVGLGNLTFGGYGPGIERAEEWPIREESNSESRTESRLGGDRGVAGVRKEEPLMEIKDFDEYEF